MVEDTPHDLVHDIAAEAVFGGHPLGRPVIGRAEVISTVSRRALAAYHRRALRRRADRRRGGRERPPRPSSSRCSTHARNGVAAEPRGARSPSGERPPPGSLPAQGHGAVPRLPERAGDLADRRAALRRVGPRRDRRRLGVVAPLPGDPREARDGVLGLQLRVAVRGHGQIGVYVGTREDNLAECLEIAVAELADIAAGNVRADELARAKENLKGRILLSLESTSNRMTRLGKATVTDTPLLGLERDRRGGSRPSRATRSPSSRTSCSRPAALRGRDRPGRGALPGGRRTGQPRAALQGRLVRVALFGAAGRSGRCSARRSRRPGHEVVDGGRRGPEGCDAAVDFTRPDAVAANVERCLAAGCPGRDRDDRVRRGRDRRRRAGRRACRASTRRTSRSEPCS